MKQRKQLSVTEISFFQFTMIISQGLSYKRQQFALNAALTIFVAYTDYEQKRESHNFFTCGDKFYSGT